MDSAKQWQFESLYLPNPKIIIAHFLIFCFFAYFCCCFEWWYLTAHLDKLPKSMLLSCAPISSISSIAQTCHQPRTSRMVSNKGVRSWTEAPPKKWSESPKSEGVNFSRLKFRGFFWEFLASKSGKNSSNTKILGVFFCSKSDN